MSTSAMETRTATVATEVIHRDVASRHVHDPVDGLGGRMLRSGKSRTAGGSTRSRMAFAILRATSVGCRMGKRIGMQSPNALEQAGIDVERAHDGRHDAGRELAVPGMEGSTAEPESHLPHIARVQRDSLM